MSDIEALYRKLVDAGVSEDQAKTIQKRVIPDIEAITDIFDREYDKLLSIFSDFKITEYRTGLGVNVIKKILYNSIYLKSIFKSPMRDEEILNSLYKPLVARGIPEAQAKIIQKRGFDYIKAITGIIDKEYEKSLRELLNFGLDESKAEIFAYLIEMKYLQSICKNQLQNVSSFIDDYFEEKRRDYLRRRL